MRFVLLGVAVLACGCPHNGGYKQSGATPQVADIALRMAKARDALTSFRAESVMDYWLGSQRVKGTVLVMGTTGAKVRFNALSPAGGDVLADMACDGTDFAYVDKQNNCQLSGPCNRSSIAQLLHVELDPDDFLHLALGTPPVLEQPTGTVTWNSSKGQWHVELKASGGTQTIDIDARDGRWDVVASEQKDATGKVVWSVENADWGTVKDDAGGDHRLPSKTRFKSPKEQADLLVDWNERTVNVTIDDAKFKVDVPPGLPPCGSKP